MKVLPVEVKAGDRLQVRGGHFELVLDVRQLDEYSWDITTEVSGHWVLDPEAEVTIIRTT